MNEPDFLQNIIVQYPNSVLTDVMCRHIKQDNNTQLINNILGAIDPNSICSKILAN